LASLQNFLSIAIVAPGRNNCLFMEAFDNAKLYLSDQKFPALFFPPAKCLFSQEISSHLFAPFFRHDRQFERNLSETKETEQLMMTTNKQEFMFSGYERQRRPLYDSLE
jgi:hypothetical protein